MKPLPRLILAALIFAAALPACMDSPNCARADVFCAGLVTDTLWLEDNGNNQDTWVGMQNLKNYGILDQADAIESVDTRDYEKNISYFASRGYDVIITSGIGLRDETLQSAARYKDLVFIGINQPLEKEEMQLNLLPITFPEDQMGFLAGAMAARVTKTGIVGAVCENSDFDSMWRYCEGFRAGVKFTNPSIRSLVMYRNNGEKENLFLDEAWGYDSASSIIQRGADVIFAAGGITAQGALRAAVESQVKAIGAERNQSAALGVSNQWLVTSIYGDAQSQTEKILRELKGERLPQNESPIKFIPFGPRTPEALTLEFKALQAGLWEQKIKPNIPTIKP